MDARAVSLSDLLADNRQGLLGLHQADPILARFRFQKRITLWFLGAGLGLPSVLLLYFMLTQTHPVHQILSDVMMPMASVALISWLVYYFGLHRPLTAIKADIAAGQVASVSGRTTRLRSFYNDDYCYITLGKQRLMGSKATYWQLAACGKELQAFYLPRARIVVMLTVIGE